MRKESRAGKEFEELIARIEKILAPKGAIIKSPDYIFDLITNQKREVDISIKIPDGKDVRLVTVECRDRKKQQDVTWIEQIVTKSNDIGAWRTYAVSSSSFSQPAIKKAKHYGIEIRQFDQITDSEIAQEWAFNSSKMKVEILFPKTYLINFKVLDENNNLVPIKTFSEKFRKTLINDLTIINFKDYFSDSDIGRINNWLNDPNQSSLPFYFSFGSQYSLETQNKNIIETYIKADYLMEKHTVNIPINSVQQYSSPEETIMQLIEGKASTDELDFKVKIRGRFKPLPSKSKRAKNSK
ncbi:hypothetical protein BH20ACI1_BH20ACI1_28640 [soil metagenome]